jgi:hypothetical protein
MPDDPVATAAIEAQIVALLRRASTMELLDFRGLLAAPTSDIEAALDQLVADGQIALTYRLAKR